MNKEEIKVVEENENVAVEVEETGLKAKVAKVGGFAKKHWKTGVAVLATGLAFAAGCMLGGKKCDETEFEYDDDPDYDEESDDVNEDDQ